MIIVFAGVFAGTLPRLCRTYRASQRIYGIDSCSRRLSSKIQMTLVPPGVANCSCRRSPAPAPSPTTATGSVVVFESPRDGGAPRCPATVATTSRNTATAAIANGRCHGVRTGAVPEGPRRSSGASAAPRSPSSPSSRTGSPSCNNLVKSVMGMAIPGFFTCAHRPQPRARGARSTGASARSPRQRPAAARSLESSRLRSHTAR